MFRGQKIQTSIERMFRIWKERRVYSNAFLKELELLIEPVRKSQVNESLPDFKVVEILIQLLDGSNGVIPLAAIVARCSF